MKELEPVSKKEAAIYSIFPSVFFGWLAALLVPPGHNITAATVGTLVSFGMVLFTAEVVAPAAAGFLNIGVKD